MVKRSKYVLERFYSGIFILAFCLVLQASAFSQSSLPYDIVFVGYDSHIGAHQSEKIGLLVTDELDEGFVFGMVNKLNNNESWESYNNQSMVNLTFKLVPGQSLKKGTLLEIFHYNGNAMVQSNGKDISDAFEITSPGSQGNFILSSGSYFTVYSGYYVPGNKDILLGSILDIQTVGVPRSTTDFLGLPGTFTNKDVFTTDQPNHGGGHVDIGDCRLCDILQIILNPDNWIPFQNSPQDDVDLSDFNLEDCAETDCEGEIILGADDCTIDLLSSPCNSTILSYEWQVLIDENYVTLAESNGPVVDPFIIDPETGINGEYRLVINCLDGCTYTEVITMDCVPVECEATVVVDLDGCTLTATVEGCATPIYNWYYLDKGGINSIPGNTSSITGTQDGEYYVVITGCPGCDPIISNFISLSGCTDCSCTQDVSLDECTVIFTEVGCEGYTDIWEFALTANGPWTTLDFHGTSYDGTDGYFYRRTLVKEGCDDVVTVSPEVNCSSDCSSFVGSASTNQECEIVINYAGCSEVVDVIITYAPNTDENSCNETAVFIPGGGFVVDNIDNGTTGVITISPDFENTCYAISLICANGCELNLFIWNGQCCPGVLTIDETDCVINTTGLPCTGTLDFVWIIDGVYQQSNSGTTVPPLTPAANGAYQLEVVCDDGCVYMSNVLNIDCVTPECEASVDIEPDMCKLDAIVEGCPNAVFQWQIDLGNGFEDIPGANGMSYIATEDLPHQVVVTNCENCEEGEVNATYTPMGCEDMCDCDVDVILDVNNCILTSDDTNCNNVLFSFWEQSNDDGATWFFVADASNNAPYIPMENAWYRKIVSFSDGCPPVFDIEVVDCLEECENIINITFSVTDECYILAEWTGCGSYVEAGFGMYFTGSSTTEANCLDNAGYPLTLPSAGTIIEIENNPANQSGHIIVDPAHGPGCYFLNFQCEGCEVIQKAFWYECCNEVPFIPDPIITDTVCNYCWLNEGPQEILDFSVELPDGTALDLSTVTTHFDFPYCEILTCSNGNTITDLINDINAWLNANGYDGQALPGPDGGGCKTNGLFHIASTNVKFLEGSFIQNGNPDTSPFLQSNCTGGDTWIFTVEGECDGATYLWETGETTESIVLPIDVELPVDVTVTCPDGCVYEVQYIGQPRIGQPAFTNHSPQILASEIKVEDVSTAAIKIYPNPASNVFMLDVNAPHSDNLKLKFINIQGQVVREQSLVHSENHKYKINAENLLSGMYMVQVISDDVTIGIEKLIIIK